MYFQFDRDKLGALRARWLRQVFRLDGQVETVSDVRAKYGNQLDEVFGRTRRPAVAPAVRYAAAGWPALPDPDLHPGAAVGWSLVLMNSSVVGSDVALLGVPGGEQIRSVSFLHLFTPEPSTLMFGFLGAYFFGVQLVLRGYVRGDLRPKAYNGITVRVIITLILAWLLQAVAGEHPATWALAFLTGVVPETAVQWIRDSLPDRPKSLRRPRRDDETDEASDLLKRNRAAHRPRGRRSVRPGAARRRGHHQRAGAGAPQPRRPDAQHPDPGGTPGRLARSGDPLSAPAPAARRRASTRLARLRPAGDPYRHATDPGSVDRSAPGGLRNC